YDKFHEKSDQIYRICALGSIGNTPINQVYTCAPLPQTLIADYPEVIQAVRIAGKWDAVLNYGDQTFYEDQVLAVDSTFFDVFSFRLLEGDPAGILREPNTVVITESIARKYFGEENAMGKIFNHINEGEENAVRVVGVMEDVPHNAHFHFNFLMALSTFEFSRSENWWNNNFKTYLVLQEGFDYRELEDKLPEFIRKYLSGDITGWDEWVEAGNYWKYILQPLEEIHLTSDLDGEIEPNGNIQYVYIFSVVGLIILLIACINFMNLSTARSATRAREIGLRKVSGAGRRSVIVQFFGESVLLAFISLVFALIIVSSILGVFNKVSGKELDFSSLLTPQFIIAMILVTLIAGLISGIYPALYLSAFRPIKVLKGDLSSGMKSGWFRKVLVIVQFTLSVFLIIGTVIIYRQLNYMKSKDLGYDRENMFYFQMRGQIKDNYQTIKDEFLRDPQVLGVSAASHQPHQIGSNSGGGDWDGRDPDMSVLIGNNIVDYDFIETMRIELKDGRSFSREFPGDMASLEDTSANFMINEVLEKIMDKENAVGERFRMWGLEGRIIGVMKNFHYHSVRSKIEPMMFILPPTERFSWIVVRVAPGDLTKTMEDLEDTWNDIMPGYPFDYNFVDESIDQMYRSEERLGNLLKYFTILAILIACLGLFGLASFTAEQRTQEIGIRKVMGARVSTVMMLLSKEFSILVIISCLIAIPASLLVMGKVFLQNFEYRTDMAWWIFLAASVAALLIAILTVSYQAARAALTNPADAL
ncbi:MAG: ABC transporter permease, partial [Bacteroidales bacterium]|nr:ABC transporter permease [Bacteroidales bacterium]